MIAEKHDRSSNFRSSPGKNGEDSHLTFAAGPRRVHSMVAAKTRPLRSAITGVGVFSLSVILVWAWSSGSLARLWSFGKKPRTDIYAIPGRWWDQNGATLELKAFRGRVAVAAFVYLKCQAVCPVIMSDVRKIEDALVRTKNGTLDKESPQFLIFLFDDARQSRADVQAFLQNYGITGSSWHILTADPLTLRSLAAPFELQYDVIDETKRVYAHTNLIAIIGSDGKIIQADYGLTEDTMKTVSRILDGK